MESSPTDVLAVDVFEIRLVDIRTVDIEKLHALSIAVQWPHRAEDWKFVLDRGYGIAALDEIGRVLGSAMWFPYDATFATVGMVITSPRLQTLGTGLALMKHVLEAASHRAVRLNATRAARRLYHSLDFHPQRTVYQCQGEARPYAGMAPGIDVGQVRPLGPGDLAAMIALDAEAFGLARTDLMSALIETSRGFGLFVDGRLDSFALCRRFGRGHVVGPVVATSDVAARAVVAPHIEAHAGTFLRVDTHRESSDFRNFLVEAQMPVFDTVTTMTRGRGFIDPNSVPAGRAKTYGLTTQALG